MKKVLFVVGSFRKGSFNHQLADQAKKAFEGKAEVDYLNYSELPLFNQDLENPTLAVVSSIREQVASADAIWIFSPVYNFGIPGTVKNLLDWLSRSLDPSNPSAASVIHEKLVTVSSVANGGHDRLFADYRFLLPFIRTQVVEDFTASRVNDTAWVDGKLVLSEEVTTNINSQAEALLEAMAAKN